LSRVGEVEEVAAVVEPDLTQLQLDRLNKAHATLVQSNATLSQGNWALWRRLRAEEERTDMLTKEVKAAKAELRASEIARVEMERLVSEGAARLQLLEARVAAHAAEVSRAYRAGRADALGDASEAVRALAVRGETPSQDRTGATRCTCIRTSTLPHHRATNGNCAINRERRAEGQAMSGMVDAS